MPGPSKRRGRRPRPRRLLQEQRPRGPGRGDAVPQQLVPRPDRQRSEGVPGRHRAALLVPGDVRPDTLVDGHALLRHQQHRRRDPLHRRRARHRQPQLDRNRRDVLHLWQRRGRWQEAPRGRKSVPRPRRGRRSQRTSSGPRHLARGGPLCRAPLGAHRIPGGAPRPRGSHPRSRRPGRRERGGRGRSRTDGRVGERRLRSHDDGAAAGPGRARRGSAEQDEAPRAACFRQPVRSPVEVPWIDRASTFLQAWYCGQEAGNAMADVLLGSVNPSGKLPVTWPKVYSDLPFGHDKEAWPGVDGVVKYKEDYQIGYRWYKHQQKKQPQWWFGDGLSYTTFEQEMLSISDDKDAWKIEVSVANTGNRKGAEVVQVYVWPAAEKEEAVLVGFEKTSVLTPQETVRVTVEVKKKDAARWVEDGWLVASAEYVFGLSVGVRNGDGKTRKVFQEQLKWSASE
ncbi:Beta-glucosidase [Colletotrichum spinosum]|uniref:beta-glucosidase n=1 Tax=Colletotrichum spinosum TaxID=1347390 RepID=A0A4R8PYI9_9PEZI|nr:Beta-glucosidase [Colletotrichum spinosum]